MPAKNLDDLLDLYSKQELSFVEVLEEAQTLEWDENSGWVANQAILSVVDKYFAAGIINEDQRVRLLLTSF
jgi:hypothetical protein